MSTVQIVTLPPLAKVTNMKTTLTLILIALQLGACSTPNIAASRYLIAESPTVSVELVQLVLDSAGECGFHNEPAKTTFAKPYYEYYTLSTIERNGRNEYTVFIIQNLQKREILIAQSEPYREVNDGLSEEALVYFNCLEDRLRASSAFKFRRRF